MSPYKDKNKNYALTEAWRKRNPDYTKHYNAKYFADPEQLKRLEARRILQGAVRRREIKAD